MRGGEEVVRARERLAPVCHGWLHVAASDVAQVPEGDVVQVAGEAEAVLDDVGRGVVLARIPLWTVSRV